MKNRSGNIAFAGVVVVVFVVLVGALGYTYLMNSNSKLAKNETHHTGSISAPAITEVSDLDKATAALESAELDTDLSSLEDLEKQL